MNIEQISAGTDFVKVASATLGEMIRHAIRGNGSCMLGLSGGSTPGPVYEELSKEMIDWSRVTFFLADDRCVGPDHPDSNQHLVQSKLFRNIQISPEQIVFPQTAIPPVDAALEYNDRLARLLAERPADIITLGLGSDGHTASLFPLLSEDAFGSAYAIHTTTDKFSVPNRISVTLPVLTNAAHAVFLLKGADKQALWQDMMNSTEDAKRWPAKAIVEAGRATVISGD